MVHPRATRQACTASTFPRWCSSTSSRQSRLTQAVLPSLVLLARGQPGAALRTCRPRHGIPRADDPRLFSGTARRSACRATCSGPRHPTCAGGQAAWRAAGSHGVRPRAVALLLYRHPSTTRKGLARPRYRRRPCGAQSAPVTAPAIRPNGEPRVDATVLICTYNRAADSGRHAGRPRSDRHASLVGRARRRQQLQRSHRRCRRRTRPRVPGAAALRVRAAPGQIERIEHRHRSRARSRHRLHRRRRRDSGTLARRGGASAAGTRRTSTTPAVRYDQAGARHVRAGSTKPATSAARSR